MSDKKTIKFEIVTPERVVLKEMITQITVPTREGEITVLPDHIPLIASLQPGVIDVRRDDGEIEIISVSGGFIEVLKNKIIILADTAEHAKELDEARIEEAKLKAEENKKNIEVADEETFYKLNAQIAKELARSSALKKWRKIKSYFQKDNK